MTDFRYAIRGLARTPVYSLTVITVLAAGMTLTTVAIAIVDGVLFKPLPFPRADEVFVVTPRAAASPEAAPPVSVAHVDAWASAAPDLTFSGVSALPVRSAEGPGQESWTAEIDERFFDVTGQRPLIGGFTPEDFAGNRLIEEKGGRWFPQIISYNLWRRSYGADPTIVGKTFVTRESDGQLFGRRIVGVLAPDFVFPIDDGEAQPDVLVPAVSGTFEQRYQAVVRIPGARDLTEIKERLTTAVRFFAPPISEHRIQQAEIRFDRVELTNVETHLGRDERSVFWIVACGTGLMLVLCCVNVAGLAAARNLLRWRELAVRRALGASPWRLVRGLLSEVFVLGVCAASVGLMLAKPLLMWALALLPPTLTLLKAPELDLRVFVMMAMASLVSVFFVTLWPARITWRLRGDAVSNPLNSSATLMGRRSRSWIITTQVALAFVLVSAGGFSVASFAAAWQTDPGFDRQRMLLFEAFVTRQRGADGVDQLRAARARLASVPGVADVAESSIQPLFGRRGRGMTNYVPRGWSGSPEGIPARLVSDNFFRVMSLDLIRGRWPLTGEWSEGQPVALVSATAAKTFWPGREAVGQTLVRQGRVPEPPVVVMGVVEDARYTALDSQPLADIYLPAALRRGRTGVYFHVRTDRSAADVRPAAVAAFGPEFRLEQGSTHEEALFAAIKHRALPAWVFGVTATTAMLVVVVGILGLLSVSVAQRTRELGIRIALGAHTAALIRLIVTEHLTPVAIGLVAGVLVSALAVRTLASHLYGIGPADPATWSAIIAMVLAVSAVGILIPAVRAARVNPIESLRAE